MARYMEHPSKASRYVAGEFIVYPGSQAENATVWFALNKDEHGEPLWEGVLAISEGADRARLVGVPLWTYNINLDDVVESGEGAPVATHVVEPSSNHTYHVVYPDRSGDSDSRWRQLIIDMEELECWFDVFGAGYIAIAAPDTTDWSRSPMRTQGTSHRTIEPGRLHLRTRAPAIACGQRRIPVISAVTSMAELQWPVIQNRDNAPSVLHQSQPSAVDFRSGQGHLTVEHLVHGGPGAVFAFRPEVAAGVEGLDGRVWPRWFWTVFTDSPWRMSNDA